jgi:hypothetical protein
MAMAFSGQHFGATETLPMPYARARRFYLTPPSLPLFFVSLVLAILAVLVTYGHLSLFRSSYAFLVLLVGYIVLAIGCLLRRV